ncbi:TonB-dependent receptor plug domain-containing protein [Desulfosarcina ovata]|nr:TonB-dependent receptor [Desulfosarcina ovata]
MVVEGRKIEERLSGELEEFGHKVEIVTGEEITAGGYADVNQILESLVPGLYVSSKSGRGDYMRMSMNGGDTKRVIFLIDGVRINNRLYGRGYLDTLSVKMIDRIEVLKTGEGLYYGTDGTSGVINIITKPVTKERHGSLGAGYGSYDAAEAHGYLSETINENGFLIYGSYDAWEGYQTFCDEDYDHIEGAARKDRGYIRNSLLAKYERNVDWGNGAVLRGSILRNEAEADFMRVDEDKAVNDRTEYVGILKWDHDIAEDLSYYVKAYYHEWWTEYTRQELDGTFVYNEALWGYEDWGVNLMGSWFFLEENELLLGFDYQNYWGKDEVVVIKGDHEEVYAGFFALRPHFNFIPDLKMSLGGRYNQTGGSDSFVWNASARSPIFGPFFARAVVGTNFRLANAYELYADEDYAIGNPDLDPEESLNVEAGLGATFGLFTAAVDYYYSEITDMIAVGDDLVFENTDGETDLESWAISLSSQPYKGFSFVLSAVYTDATNKDDDVQLTHIPESFYKGLLRYWHPSRRFGGDLSVRYIGDVYGTDYPEFGAVNYGKYWVTDISGFVRFGNDLAHTLTLRVDNLFDKDYTTYGYGRTTGSDGEPFIYEYQGTPLALMLSYTYDF